MNKNQAENGSTCLSPQTSDRKTEFQPSPNQTTSETQSNRIEQIRKEKRPVTRSKALLNEGVNTSMKGASRARGTQACPDTKLAEPTDSSLKRHKTKSIVFLFYITSKTA